MDRSPAASRRGSKTGASGSPDEARADDVPAQSRLTVKPRRNRRRPQPVWSRVPNRRELADACGRALRRSLPAIVATIAILGIGTSLWLGYRFITTSERFAITSIEVRGTSRLTAGDVRAILPVDTGANIFVTDLDEVTAALDAHPWIASASAHRILPHTLVVEIREHVPLAVVDLGELYLVDGWGRPFARTAEAASGLPVIVGLARETFVRDPSRTARTILRALGALAAWRTGAHRPAIESITIDARGAIALRATHATIELGQLDAEAGDVTARLRVFDAVWSELTDDERARTRTLHLDGRPDHVTVAFAKDL